MILRKNVPRSKSAGGRAGNDVRQRDPRERSFIRFSVLLKMKSVGITE